MPSGISIGSAYFEFLATNTDLIAKSAQSEQVAKQAYDAIAQAAGVSAAAVERAAKQEAAAIQQFSDARAATALKTIRAYNDEADAAEKAAQKMAASQTAAVNGFRAAATSAVGFGAALVGVQLGAAGLHKTLEDLYDATKNLDQAQFALNVTYKDATPALVAFSQAQSQATEFSVAAYERSLAALEAFNKEGNLSVEQDKKLVEIAADLAAQYGTTLPEALKALEGGLKGRAGALSQYGDLINQKIIKAEGDLTASEKANFGQLSEGRIIQAAYVALLKETGDQADASAAHLKTLEGSSNNLHSAISNLAGAIGKELTPAIVDANNQAADFLKWLNEIPGTAQRAAEALSITAKFMEAAALAASFDFAGAAAKEIEAINQLATANQRIQEQIDKQPKATEAPGAVLGPTPDDIAEAERAYGEIVQRNLKQAHDARVADIEDQKKAAEREEQQQLQSLSDQKDAQLAAIHEQAQAAKDASEAKIAQLRDEEAAAKAAVEQEKQDTLDGLAVAKKAADDAAAEQIRQLEVKETAEKQATDATYKAEIAALDAVRQERQDAFTQEDRQLRDHTEAVNQAEDDRHQHVVRGLDDEAKADNDKKDKALRNLEDVARAAEEHHQDRLKAIQDEGDAAQKTHDATVSNIEAADRAANAAHDQRTRQLSDEQDAAQKAHDVLNQQYQDQGDAAKDAHDATIRRLDDEATAAEHVHSVTLDGIEAESKAAQTAHDQQTRALDDELHAAQDRHDTALAQIGVESDAAETAHKQALRQIDAEASAEDDRHRNALAAIDAEKQAREDAIDAQIAGLDALDKAAQNASTIQGLNDRLAGAQFGVLKAQSSGNQSEIDAADRQLLEAQQALADAQGKIARDSQRQQLQDQKQALADQVRAEQDAENERDRVIKDGIALSKQAADDELDRVKTVLAGRKAAADASLKLVQDQVSADKLAASDELTRIKTLLDARKAAADGRYQEIKDQTDAEKQAATDALKLIQDDLAAKKRSNDDQLASTKDRIDAEKRAADDQYTAVHARFDQQKRDADDRLTQAKDRIKQEQDSEDLAYRKNQDRLTSRRRDVDDQNKHELDGIATRKQTEQDAHDHAVNLDHDAAQQANDALADRKRKADEIDAALRTQANTERDEANERTRKIYRDQQTGLIPAIEAARHAADENFEAQRVAAERSASAQIAIINEAYNGPAGQITLAQKAQHETEISYQNQAIAVEKWEKEKRRSIQASYRAPDGHSGILDHLDALKDQTDKALKDDIQKWDDWRKGLVEGDGPIKKTWEQATAAFDAYMKHVREESGKSVPSGPGGGGGGAPGNPGTPSPGGGGSNDYGNRASGQYWEIPSSHQRIELGTNPGTVAPTQAIPNIPYGEVIDFIRKVAPQYGIPVDDAERVYEGEGQSAYVGDSGTSFGPYQLHIGGGLGDDFQRVYNEDIRDPSTWQDQILYTMAYVQAQGWNGQWHGAPPSIANKHYAGGGIIDRDSWLVDRQTGQPWGRIAEGGRPEMVIGQSATAAMSGGYIPDPQLMLSLGNGRRALGSGGAADLAVPEGGFAAGASGPIEHMPVNLILNNQIMQQAWITGYQLHARRGSLPGSFGALA